MGWYNIVHVKFEYGICLFPEDLHKKSFLSTDREIREFRWNLPWNFSKTHQMLDYEPLTKGNTYGDYMQLSFDVFDYNPFEWGFLFE